MRLNTIDKPLLYTTLTLLACGILILASASMVISQKSHGSIVYFALHQLLYGIGLGIITGFFTTMIPYRIWRKFSLPLMIFSLFLLAFLFIPQLSPSIKGAHRWIQFGPLSIQPSEILKLVFIIYLASWLDSRKQEVTSISYGLIPFTVMLAIISMFLIMQPDLGTLFVIIGTAGLLYFLAGGKISQIVTLSILGLSLIYLVVQIEPYRLQRISVFLNPRADPQGIGYQINQAFIAIGSGGPFGLGFGKGIQKYNYLPEPMGDSIFAIFAEEMGFLGVLSLLTVFGFFLWRGLQIAKRTPDIFGKLLSAGITISIATQAFINMAAISGLLPLTGIPLPFISYGGTSLMITIASVGILLNISKETY